MNDDIRAFLRIFLNILKEVAAENERAMAEAAAEQNYLQLRYNQGGHDFLGKVLEVLTRVMEDWDKAVETPKHPMDKDYMKEAARAVEAKLPDNHGFILLVAPYGDVQGRTFYISTAERSTAVNWMKEFLLKAGPEEWLKHVE